MGHVANAKVIKGHLSRLAAAERSVEELAAVSDLSQYLTSLDVAVCSCLDNDNQDEEGDFCKTNFSLGETLERNGMNNNNDEVFQSASLRKCAGGKPDEFPLSPIGSMNNSPDVDTDDIEQRFLLQGLDSSGPFPMVTLTAALPSPADRDAFVAYALQRRYGWSEGEGGSNAVTASDSFHAGRFRRLSGRRKSWKQDSRDVSPSRREGGVGDRLGESETSAGKGCGGEKVDVEVKLKLNKLLDDFIKWIFSEGISDGFLKSIEYALSQAHHQAVVRKQTYYHFLEWIRTNCLSFDDDAQFDKLMDILVAGLTDIWSAIRSMSAAKLNSFVDRVSCTQLESLFSRLVQISMAEQSAWQAKEGAILGIYTTMRKFCWGGSVPSAISSVLPSSPRGAESTRGAEKPSAQSVLKFGKLQFNSLPEYISSQMHDLVFALLRHEQLTIREHASRTFSIYLSRCEFKEALTSLKEVVGELRKGLGLEQIHTDAAQVQIQWMDAFSSEGLLSVCISLIKHIPPKYFMSEWDLYFSTFSLFLMHPASTVRQAASTLFKFLVAKDTTRPAIVAMVLDGLSKDWQPDTDLLQQPEEGVSQSGTSSHADQSAGASHRVKLRESRVKGCRRSVSKLTSTADSFSDTWEWREGRLLAYELTFRFLIKNHWVYTFGIPSSYNGSALDLSRLNPSHSLTDTSDTKKVSPKVEKTNSYAGQSLRDRSKQFAATDEPKALGVRGGLHMRRATMDHMKLDSPAPSRSTKHASYYESTDESEPRPRTRLTSLHSKSVIVNLLQLDVEQKYQRNSQYSDTVSAVLKRVLFQCIECLADGRWELRRMALQVIPCVVEMIRWYDIKLLEAFWLRYLDEAQWEPCKHKTGVSLAAYGACLSFVQSMTHGAKLKQLQKEPPDHWKNVRRSLERTNCLVSAIDRHLTRVLPVLVTGAVSRPACDKLSVLCATGLLQAAAAYDVPGAEILSNICHFYYRLMTACHPTHPLCIRLMETLPEQPTIIFTDGFLSCNPHKSDSLQFGINHLEKHALGETHSLLCEVVKRLDIGVTNELLPIVAFYFHWTHEEHHVNKSFYDALQVMLRKSTQEIESTQGANGHNTRLLEDVMELLCGVLLDKACELHTIKQTMELAVDLALMPTETSVGLNKLVLTISTLLSEMPSKSVPAVSVTKDICPATGLPTGLQLLDNAIHQEHSTGLPSFIDQADTDEEDEDEEEVAVLISETLVLAGTSPDTRLGNLPREVSERSSAPPTTDDDSDWDSWEDEDEDEDTRISYLMNQLSNVIVHLKQTGRGNLVVTAVNSLSPNTRRAFMAYSNGGGNA